MCIRDRSQADWLRHTGNRLFQIPLEQLTSGAGEDVRVDETTLRLKGTRIRLDSGSPGEGYAIYDVATRESWLVSPADRSFVHFSADEVEAAAQAAARDAEEAMAAMGVDIDEIRREAAEYEPGELDAQGQMDYGEPRVRSLDRTERLNGFQASAYEAVSEEEFAVGWCARDASQLQATMKKLTEMAGAMEDEEEDEGSDVAMGDLLCGDGIPVRVHLLSPFSGMDGEYTIEEVLSIEETSVPDDVFEIPTGFKKKTLEELWGIGG